MSYRARVRLYLVLIATGLAVVGWACWDTAQERHTLATDRTQRYWLHVPAECEKNQLCPVFVFVHGTGGSGRDCIKLWRGYADQDGFVAVCPQFQLGYQTLDGKEDEKLLAILDEVARQQATTSKAFVSGFSGGAQFAHRFAFAHPERVQAVAAHSAGWYDAPPQEARQIPFLVTVGLNDKKRIEWARWFTRSLKDAGYDAKLVEFEGVGHSLCEQAIQETMTFFRRFNH